MKRISPILVGCLVVCLLVVSGVLTAQAVEHSQHHSQHHKGTHATLICSWFCAAGQTLEADTVLVEAPAASFIPVAIHLPHFLQEFHLVSSVSRAPPSCL